jgi:hypothetical protein
LVEKKTAKVLDRWRQVVSGVAWEWMVRRISIGLVFGPVEGEDLGGSGALIALLVIDTELI